MEEKRYCDHCVNRDNLHVNADAECEICVNGSRWFIDPTAHPEFLKLRADLQRVTEERDEAREELRQTWEAIRELSLGCHGLQVSAHYDGEVYAVSPDKVTGVFEGVKARIKQFKGWGNHAHWTSCIDGADRADTLAAENKRLREALEEAVDACYDVGNNYPNINQQRIALYCQRRVEEIRDNAIRQLKTNHNI